MRLSYLYSTWMIDPVMAAVAAAFPYFAVETCSRKEKHGMSKRCVANLYEIQSHAVSTSVCSC